MGKGDKKSRRGKIHIGSFGTRRPRKVSTSVPGKVVPAVAEAPLKMADVKSVKMVEKAEPMTDTPAETKKVARKTTKKTKETE